MGCADAQRVIAVAARVEDLQGNLAAVPVDRAGNGLVGPGCRMGSQAGGKGQQPALDIGREATSHHQADATPGPFRKVRREAGEVGRPVFETGVHGTHQHPVAQGGEAQVEGRQQVRIGHGHSRIRPGRNGGSGTSGLCGALRRMAIR